MGGETQTNTLISMFFAVFVQSEQEKCAQYWPSKEERDMDFSDAGFVVTLVSEDVEPNYIIRLLELKNDKVNVMLNHCHWILL